MNDEVQREWPSFDDILRELDAAGAARIRRQEATDAVASPTLASMTDGMRLDQSSAQPIVEDLTVHDDAAHSDVDRVPPALSDAPAALTDPLNLDLPMTSSTPAIDTSALEPIPEIEIEAIPEPSAEIDQPAELPDPELEPTAEIHEAEVASTDAPAADPLDATVDPLTGTIDWKAFDEQAKDVSEKVSTEAIDDWASSEPSWAAQPATTPTFVFDQDIVEPLAETPAEPAETEEAAVEPSETQGDRSDSDDDELQAGQIVELHADDESSESKSGWVTTAVDGPDSFDSVATADAIENDLSELFDIDAEQSNVIPIHTNAADNSEAVVGLDGNVDPAAPALSPGAWAGKRTKQRPEDPWAYMRPDPEEDVKKGFWKNRPKLFGGDERKTKRAEREAELQAMIPDEAGSPCSDCGGKSVVDLQDPASGKVHLSCTACKKTWTEYTQLGKEA